MRAAVLAILVASTSLASAEPVQVTLGAEVGGGAVTMFGTRYGTVNAGIELDGATWLSPHLGVGLRLAQLDSVPVRDPHMDGYPIVREAPWIVEPQLLARTISQHRRVRLGWLASVGVGAAVLRTQELCGGGGSLGDDELSSHSCVITKQQSTALEGSVSAGGYGEAYHVAMFVGLRASTNSGGDSAAGLVANLGATF
jgi:hypothetical protein